MPFGDLYERQVRLLIRTLPFVLVETEFALKGGTAINLFVRDLPRLSVEIDLTYLPVPDRAESWARPPTDGSSCMCHCHVLEHEDNGMVGQFTVQRSWDPELSPAVAPLGTGGGAEQTTSLRG